MQKIKCFGKDEKLEPLCTVVGNENSAATKENNVAFPKKLKIELPYNPATPLLGIYLKN